MDAEKIAGIISKMETRKNCTNNAKTMLYEIMEEMSSWIDERITILNPYNVGVKWTHDWGDHSSCGGLETVNMVVYNGKVGLRIIADYGSTCIVEYEIPQEKIDFISIKDATNALIKLIDKIDKLPDRVADLEKIQALRDVIVNK